MDGDVGTIICFATAKTYQMNVAPTCKRVSEFSTSRSSAKIVKA